jgi:tetratricopeptide (TPR) repeat protein
MLQRTFPALLFLSMLGATLPGGAAEPAAKPEPPDAKELLRQANDLWHLKEDYNGALAAFNQAVDSAPKDTDIRVKRAYFFEVVSGVVKKEDRERFKDLARQDYQKVADDEPDSVRAGVARDGLTRLTGTTLLRPASVTCPTDAANAYQRAESLYSAHHLAEAVSQYEKATAGCPTAATYWVDFADAYYGMEQFEKAKELFRKGLDADPWSRSGHRYLADTEWRLKNVEETIHEAALAVVSDPVYEAAWASLRDYANASGRGWKRVFATKTEVTATGSEKDGDANITITLPADESATAKKPGVKVAKSKAGTQEGIASSDGTGWLVYGMSKALALTGTVIEEDASGKPVERKVDPKTLTTLELDRLAVHAALEAAREVTTDPSSQPGPFWAMMMRADKAGFLDEAILLHMLDEPLAKDYPAYREKNAAKLVEYLETMIVPKN